MDRQEAKTDALKPSMDYLVGEYGLRAISRVTPVKSEWRQGKH